MLWMLMLLTLSCQTEKNEGKVITPSKFGEKFKNLHQTIVIQKPGVYDYGGVMHIWKGGGYCSIIGAAYPVMEIHSDNVTVRNFGFKEAMSGIQVFDKENGEPRKSVYLENIEGRACYQALSLPSNSQNILVKDSLFLGAE